MNSTIEKLTTSYLDALQWRYATKKFDASKRISETDLATLKEAIRLSASSYGLQPYSVMVISNSALREKLRPACWNQPQITDASHVFVFAGKKDFDHTLIDSYLELVSTARNLPIDSLVGYGNFMKSKLLKKQRPPGQVTRPISPQGIYSPLQLRSRSTPVRWKVLRGML